MLVALGAERQALVNGDVPDAERTGALAHRDADVIRHEEALPVRPELGVGLPRDHAETLEPLHVLEVAGLVRVHAAMEQQAVRAFHALDDLAGRGRLLDRERLLVARRRHEREHHQVGVGVHEDVLDELLRSETAQVAVLAGCILERALGLRKALEPGRNGRRILEPGAFRVHVVALHVEDEFLLAELRRRELLIERGVSRHLEEAAGAAGRRVRRIEREERRGSPAGRDEKGAARLAHVFRELGRPLIGQRIGVACGRLERNGREFAIGRRIDLDGQAATLQDRRRLSWGTYKRGQNVNSDPKKRGRDLNDFRSILGKEDLFLNRNRQSGQWNSAEGHWPNPP